MAEELIHALARIQGLRVVARTSAFALKDKALDVREIGRLLNVGAVLEGSVRSAGGRLRITAQLINVEDGYRLWSERFDRDAGDVFAVQDEITASIVEHLKVTLRLGERTALQKRATADPEAYALYLKGQYFLNRPGHDTFQSALRFFNEALARDPSFARAHAGIASVWGAMANFDLRAAHRGMAQGQGGARPGAGAGSGAGRGPCDRGDYGAVPRVGLDRRRRVLRTGPVPQPGRRVRAGVLRVVPPAAPPVRRVPVRNQAGHRLRPAVAAPVRVLRGSPRGERPLRRGAGRVLARPGTGPGLRSAPLPRGRRPCAGRAPRGGGHGHSRGPSTGCPRVGHSASAGSFARSRGTARRRSGSSRR